MIRPSRPARLTVSRPTDRRNGADAVVVTVALLIAAVIAVPGSMAAWVETEQTGALVVSTGTADLHIAQVGGGVPRLSPGQTSSGPVYVLENAGDVPLEVTAGVSVGDGALGSATTVTLGSGGSEDCGGAAVSVSPGVSSPPFARLDPGETTYMCTTFSLATTTPDAAQYEAEPAFTITMTGVQVR
ncbi:hypothetical protein [Microbacterium paludicola]|uniref:hypothetical protein n=1 Tax=Microbacterium paludicola TaxID=300019 RepID=UPI0011A53E3F|nr:hypothetical protein [Microbacterium paludicola]